MNTTKFRFMDLVWLGLAVLLAVVAVKHIVVAIIGMGICSIAAVYLSQDASSKLVKSGQGRNGGGEA